VRGAILDGFDQIDGREHDGYSERELRGVRCEVKDVGLHVRRPRSRVWRFRCFEKTLSMTPLLMSHPTFGPDLLILQPHSPTRPT